jgi:hypothetical protein
MLDFSNEFAIALHEEIRAERESGVELWQSVNNALTLIAESGEETMQNEIRNLVTSMVKATDGPEYTVNYVAELIQSAYRDGGTSQEFARVLAQSQASPQ